MAYTAPQTQNIEQIRVGDRVATNLSPAELAKAIGEASNAPEWDHLDAQIDPAAWRQVEFVAQGEQGQRFEITLLRPLSWLEEAAATVGGQIHLVLPEQGLDGPATVLAIHACPPIQSGSGRVVTGTITHIRGGILNLYVEGESEPLGVTENHPIYSVRHCDFVSAGDLQPGDQLRKLDGTLANINRVESLIGEQRVFNLEVHGEHVYRVTSNGLLVHNACPDPRWTKNYDPGELVKDHKLARVFGGSDDPTNIRLLALEANARKGGYEGNLVKFRNWLMANGMNEESANLVIKPELDALMNGVAERPMDPSFFDQF